MGDISLGQPAIGSVGWGGAVNTNFALIAAAINGTGYKGTVHLGASAPATPVAGQLWMDTADGMLWQYDGTYWTSAALFHTVASSFADLTNSAGAVSGNAQSIPWHWPVADRLKIVDLLFHAYRIGTVQDATNHFLVKAAWFTGAAWNVVGGGVTTEGAGESTWAVFSGSVNTVLNESTLRQLSAYASPVGTPGRCLFIGGVTYRFVRDA